MAPKVKQYIVGSCKMQHSFTRTFRGKVCKNCANRFLCCVSIIYCFFHSASHSCGSDEGSLQPSLWLPKLRRILQKLPKCSTALHGPFTSKVRENFTKRSFCSFLQYTVFSTEPATHVAVMREAYSHQYVCQSSTVYCRNFQNAAQLYMRH